MSLSKIYILTGTLNSNFLYSQKTSYRFIFLQDYTYLQKLYKLIYTGGLSKEIDQLYLTGKA